MVLWFLAAFAAYLMKGLCGFANTLIFTSILSFGTPNANISPIDLLMGYPANVILTWKNRKRLEPRVYLPLIGLVLAGSIPGTLLLKNAEVGTIKLIFGGVVIILGAEMLLRECGRRRKRFSGIILAVIGILSGMLCGLFGVGALLAAYVSRVTEDTASFKANISAVFIADNTVRMILYCALHIITADTVRRSLLLLPVAFAGLLAGMKCSSIVNERLVRRLTAGLLMLSGVVLILKTI